MRYLFPILFVLLLSSVAYAVAMTASISQLGSGESPVQRHYVRVLSVSINVNNNSFNNQITGGSVSVASTVPGTYFITITVSSGAQNRVYSVTASLSTTPTTITFTLSPSLPYVSPGATITVRADPV